MTHTELRAAIQEIICDLYDMEFTGKIIIRDIKPMGQQVGFEDHQYQPTWYSASLPDDEFLKFIRQALRTSAMFQALRFKTVRNTTVFRENRFIG